MRQVTEDAEDVEDAEGGAAAHVTVTRTPLTTPAWRGGGVGTSQTMREVGVGVGEQRKMIAGQNGSGTDVLCASTRPQCFRCF